MNKAWIVSSLLGVGALWVGGARIFRHNSPFGFLDGAQWISAEDIAVNANHYTHVETFSLHMPFGEAWSRAQNELCAKDGWRLGFHTEQYQDFLDHGSVSVSLVRGKVDAGDQFIPGTENTDTYVEVRKAKG